MKASPRKQPATAVHVPNRMELWLWTGLLLLIVGGSLLAWLGSGSNHEIAAPPPMRDNQPQSVSGTVNAGYQFPTVHDESPAALLLEKFRAICDSRDSDNREEMLAAFVDQIAIADIQSTFNHLQMLEQSDLIRDLSLRLVRRWAENDGHAAAAWAEQLPAGSMREDALSGVAIEWANTGLKDAADWASQLPDSAEHGSALLAVANEAVRQEPVEALDIAVGLPPNTQRDQLIQHAAMEWASQDGQAAADWARQIADVSMRDQILAAVATAWSDSNPVSAATLAVREISEGRSQSDAVIGIVERWAQRQPQQAIAWVEQFPEGELKQTAIENLTSLGIIASN